MSGEVLAWVGLVCGSKALENFLPGGAPRASHARARMLMVRHIGLWGVTERNPHLGLIRILVNPHRVYGLIC